MHRILASLTLALLLTGCASSPRLTAPDTLDPKSQPTVVLGYFTKAHHLGIESCPSSELDGIAVDCFGPNPTVVLVVQEVLFGSVPDRRIKLLAFDVENPEQFPLGPRHPVLAYPSPWDSLNEWHELSKTRDGEWAVRIHSTADLPDLPCAGEQLLNPVPLDFRRPGPAPEVGITLSAIRKAREDMLKDDYYETCWHD